ncbi:MAG: hypothetical protein HY901_00620 [Deltaproteobacteria bacterium]|nr:hypothetical protein [Deltaproteobacteria bacterium]
MYSLAPALALLIAASAAHAQAISAPYPSNPSAFPSGQSETLNIVHWTPNDLPKVYQRSDQPPLTDAEVAKLSKAGFEPADIVKMIEERRCACDATAAGLIALKRQGVAKEVLSAISLHALKPNRALTLVVTVDFIGPAAPAARANPGSDGIPRNSELYFFVDDGPLTRTFFADVSELLRHHRDHVVMVDRSDLLLAKSVRRIELAGEFPLKVHGPHTLFVTSAARATVTHPSQLSETERERGQTYHFEYPRASEQRICRLHLSYQGDLLLPSNWSFAGSQFECEWN